MQTELSRIEPDARGARRILCDHINEAAAELSGRRIADEKIHAARKSLKKARATLRIMRDAIPERTYRRENRVLRDAARPLSIVRDARVLLDTLQLLERLYGPAAEQSVPAAFVQKLEQAQTRARRAALSSSRSSDKQKAPLLEARRRVSGWRISELGWAPMGTSLKRTYAQGRKALKQARRTPTPDCLHEWRKRTKHLWHQLQILEPMCPGEIGELADRAHKLSDYLGDHHDLAVLRETVHAQEKSFAGTKGPGALLALIDRCQRQLGDKAFQAGSTIYEDAPKRFAARFSRHWKRWQSA
jgi:CHAD domain-containing protein